MLNEELMEILSQYPAGYRVRAELLDVIKENDKDQIVSNQEVTAVGVENDKHIITIRGEI